MRLFVSDVAVSRASWWKLTILIVFTTIGLAWENRPVIVTASRLRKLEEENALFWENFWREKAEGAEERDT